jgi:signal peptidase II
LSEQLRGREPPQRPLEIRVGSATNALEPVSVAERALSAGPAQWLALGLVAAAVVSADQLTKRLVATALTLGHSVEIVGPFSIHHVRNSGIAFGLFSSATSIVIVLTSLAVGAMVVFFARSGQRHPMLPVALGFVLGGSVSNLVDRLRFGHVHRDRRSAALRLVRRRRPHERARWDGSAFTFLTRLRASVSTASSPDAPRWGRDPRPSG